MPSPKGGEKLSDGWTLTDQVEELRGKYHLKTKDGEAYRESSKREIRLNEKVIAYLRQDNRAHHIRLAQDENGDERVIKSVFKDDRTERLSLQRCTAAEAIGEMDQKNCEAGKFLNALLYEREKRETKLLELNQELERMFQMEKKSPEQKEMDTEMTRLENSLDKADVKYRTAKIISTRYQDILERLKEESMTLPAQLDAMEAALLQQKSELKQLKVMCKDAQVARDEAKRELSQVEHDAYEAKRQRDSELLATRKEVERRKAESEKVDKKAARLTLVHDNVDHKAMMEKQKKRENQTTILAYEDAVEKIKMATHVTDIGDVVSRVTTQKDTHGQLAGRVQELEGQRNRTKDDLDRMTTQYHDMKYTGEQKLSSGERFLEKMQEQIDEERTRYGKAGEFLERNGSTLLTVKTGIATLLEKLNEVKLKPPNYNYTKGDVFDQMDLCSKKIEHLLGEFNLGPQDAPVTPEIPVDTQEAEFQDFLENQISPENVRIKVQESETQLSEFDYDGQENEVLSRTDIKRMGQKLIDSKQRPRKKGKKKT